MAEGKRAGMGGRVIGILLGLIGLYFAILGGYLLSLGGSPYYVLAGLASLYAGWRYLTGRGGGLAVFLVLFLATVIWAIAEVGFDFWQLLPRIAGPLVVSVILILHDIARRQGARTAMIPTGIAIAAAIIAIAGMRGLPQLTGGTEPLAAVTPGQGTDWLAYGQAPGGGRFASASQITPANIAALEPAWTFRTGDSARPGEKVAQAFQNTPLKVGDTLYLCTGRNRVIALDAETGDMRWSYDPKLDITKAVVLNCRGVSYAETPDAAQCPRRIITGTLDARLIAVNAETGKPCPGFGKDGTVDLTQGLGKVTPGQYSSTSPPVVANGVIIMNGFVLDNMTADAPGGVIRAYDVKTGAFKWAWDPGREDENAKLAAGQNFIRDTPNSWSAMSADPELGLVYVPTGNATPDYVGTHRSKESDRYNSSIIALDIQTGERRWNFQTVHHDVFDLDIPAQPVLFDWPAGDGSTVPALAQPTKQGHIFILDRRTGKSLIKVEERPAPKGGIPGENYSPTQPATVGFPSFAPATLTEKDMWGATAFDQLLCRIKFRQLDYRGAYTPPSLEGSLQYPGNFGVLNWGSIAIDPQRQLLIANASYMPITTKLVPRAEADRRMDGEGFHPSFQPQVGTPYGIDTPPFLSQLGLPCTAPPWGRLAAIDLKTRQFVWNKPFGTTRDHAPLGIATPGTFNIGGAVTTGGGVTFIAAAIDGYLRAYDTKTGAELWRAKLPAGGQATPMSYISEKSGRQFVVIAAGGSTLLQTRTGDYVMAFALPKK